MDKTIDRWTDPDGNGYAFKDTVARAQNRATIDKMNAETADRKSELDIERKRIDNLVRALPNSAGEYQQSKMVLHGYGNAKTKCGTTSGQYTNVPAFTTDAGGVLSSLYTKKSNYQIAVNKAGLYLFELRIHINSLTANKRVELAPFVNGERNAALASSYNTAGNFTLTKIATLPMWLSTNDTIDFRITPIEAAEVSVELGDVLVYAIDWDDKFKIPDYTGYVNETKDLRVGVDGTTYDTAGQAMREQIGSLKEDLDNVYNTTELTPVPTNKITPTEILDKSVYYNSTYGLLGFTNNGDNLKCNIYPIIKGKSYYLIGNGKNHEGCPVAIFAESYVSDGTTKYKEVVSGESEKLHNIKKFFKASYDGYIYINCINELDGLFNVEYVSNIQKINNSLKNELDCKLSLYGEFQLVESTIINNKVFNINKLTEQNQSDGCYMREKINNDDDIIRVSGYSYSSNISYPLIAFFDEYDNIIEYYGDASTLYSDKIFKIPYRTNYIIVNGKTSNIKVEKFILKNNLTETVESLKKQTTFANIKSVEKQNEKYEIKNIKISDFEIIQNKLYTFTAKMDESDRYSTVLLKFNLELNSIKILYGAGVYGGAFLDKDKKYISSINAGTLDVVVTVPQDTTYIAYTYSNGMTDFEIGVLYNIYESKQFTVPGISHFLNPWENKKIVLLGTSVGFGSNATTSYIYEASKYLGFNFVNTSVPGLAIHTESDGRPLIYGSSSLSVSEYASNGKILSTAPVDYVPGGKYNTYYQSYERIFTDKNADADLWLYAVAPNNDNFDLKDWNDFNKSSWKYNDESGFDEHRTTFIGALLFLMNKMYELNPNARMAFVLDSAFAYGDSQGGGNIKTVANYWGIPVIDLWGKINRSPKSLEVIKSKNGTDSHPSTFGHEKMGMMMVGELLRIG